MSFLRRIAFLFRSLLRRGEAEFIFSDHYSIAQMTAIDPLLKEINELLYRIEALSQRRSSGFAQNLKEAIDRAIVTSKRIAHEISQRQLLIEKQIRQKYFRGKLHDEYHTTNLQIDTDIDSILSTLKQILNRLISIIICVVPKDLKRGLSDGSFGRFLNDLDKLKNSNPWLNQFAAVMIPEGKRIDETICDYRDKYIEHVKNPIDSGIQSSGLGGIKKIHQASKRFGQSQKVMEHTTHSRDRIDDTIKCQLPDGSYIIYVHVTLNPSLKAGDNVGPQDAPLGYVSDGNSGHFQKYGPHRHVYTTPDLDLPKMFAQQPGIDSGSYEVSPDPFDALLDVLNYIRAVLHFLLTMDRDYPTDFYVDSVT